MSSYFILGILFTVIFFISLGLFIYFKNDEKYVKSINNKFLLSIGKTYTKDELESALYNEYKKIIEAINNNDFNYLKDAVSDNVYNDILLKYKNNLERNNRVIYDDILKIDSEIINYKRDNNLEIVDVFVKYSCMESTVDILTNKDIDLKKKMIYTYIVTFVKDISNSEEIICPNCGYKEKISIRSKCIRCDSFILPKTKHWVYVKRKESSINVK